MRLRILAVLNIRDPGLNVAPFQLQNRSRISDPLSGFARQGALDSGTTVLGLWANQYAHTELESFFSTHRPVESRSY